MVDFQSRDTRRSADEDDEEGDEPPATDEPDEPESATEAEDRDEGDAEGGGFAVVSVGADRSVDDDPPGAAAIDEIERAGEAVATREVIKPRYDGIQSVVDSVAERGDVAAVVTVGGTGVEPADVTVDAVEPLFDKRLPGFGELFRIQGYDEVGTEVIGTRTTAGMIEGVPVFCLPGAPDAARRGVRDLVLPEADWLAALAGVDQ